jgi:mannan endo-1,4-beta-mannosidase
MKKILSLLLLMFALQSYGESFVKASGTNLVQDGKRYIVKGTNQYYLFYKSKKMIDEVIDDAAAMGLNTLRTWGFCEGELKDGYCFQPSPRAYHEPTFQKMDYIIYKASQKGIKLVIPLVNNWDAFGGMNQYVSWSPTAPKEHDAFYTDAWTRQLYKDYASYFLNRVNTITGVRYKDDPTIMMWELTNEMRAQSDYSGSKIQDWVVEMSAWIKRVDSNHLLSTGMEGFGRNENKDWLHDNSQGTRYIENHAVKDIDVVAFHLYPDHWGISKEYSLYWIASSIKIAQESIGKPVICGEFGFQNRYERAAVYKDWYSMHKAKNGDGMMFWLLSGKQDDGSLYPDYDGFTVYFPEDKEVVQVIKEGG